MTRAERKRLVGIRQVLDDIEENDDVQHPELRKRGRINNPGEHVQALLPRMRGGIVGNLDTRYIEIAPGFLQEEPIGAADIEQPAAALMPADEVYRMGEFAPQHRLSSAIIRVTVSVGAGEIIGCIVVLRVKARRLSAAKPACRALQNVAAVLGIENAMLCCVRAGRTGQLHC